MKRNSVWGITLKAGTIQATQVFGSRKEAEDAIAKISHLSNGFEAVELGPVNSPELPDGWIPCAERMPECGQWDHAAVIVSEGNNSFIAYYNKRDGKFLDEPFGMSVGNKVTHWQPLPAPPTTEK